MFGGSFNAFFLTLKAFTCSPNETHYISRLPREIPKSLPVEQRTFLIADAQPANPLDPPAVTRLQEISCPVFIVVGALDHPEVLRAGDLMAATLPNARHSIVEGAGHVPSYERPDAFNKLLLDFLADVRTSQS